MAGRKRGRTEWGGGVWVEEAVVVVVRVKQKPIVVDSTFILTDTCFPFVVWNFVGENKNRFTG